MQRVTTIECMIKVSISMIRHCNATIFPTIEIFNIVSLNTELSMDASHHIYVRFV
jgi:hypothetical protein